MSEGATPLGTSFDRLLGRLAASRFSVVSAVIAAATLLMMPAFVAGHIVGHSSILNVVWSEGFSGQLFAGDLYPRWLPEVSRGAGSAVFYFYGPLPFYLTAPFHLLADPRLAVVLGCWLMLGLSGLSFFALANTFVGGRAALVAAIVYMAMPYHLLADVWVRAALGEQAAFVLIPLCLLCAFRLGDEFRYAFGLAASFAGLLLSHLPSALIFAPFLVAFCLWTAWQGKAVTVLFRAVLAALLAGGLAAAYVVPAMLLQDMVQADNWGVHRPEKNLLFAAGGAFATFLAFVFGGACVVVASAAASMIAAHRGRSIAFWIIASVVLAFLMTPLSGWLWQSSPVLERIQFPWRALVLFELCACMLLAFVLDARPPGTHIVVQLLGVCAIVTFTLFLVGRGVLGSETALVKPMSVENDMIAIAADAPEYLPSCGPPADIVELTTGKWYRIVDRALAQRGPGVLPVFYYPFLSVTADGVPVPIACDPATGLIAADVPAGAKVEIAKKSLPIERLAYGISLVSLAVLITGVLLSSRFSRRRQVAHLGEAVR